MKISTIKSAVIISILMIFGTTKLYSQDTNNSKGYLSYFGNDSTNINMTHVPCHSADLKYNISGVIYNRDTIRINGNLYMYRVPQENRTPDDRYIHFYFPRYDTLFLREEQETGRLYRYYRNYFGTGETEKMICDMSLNVGDKIIYPTGLNMDCLAEDSLVVYSVDIIDGIKEIRLLSSYYNLTFREGVFPNVFPLWQEPLYSDESEPSQISKLLCVHKDGEQVYVNQSYGCYGTNPWSVDEKEEEPFTINPNPTNSIVTISGENISKIEVLNALGQKVSEIECCEDEITIDFSSQPNGIYFLNITDKKGEKITKKVVKQ